MPPEPPLTLADVFRAQRRIAPYLSPTPVVVSATLDQALGCRVLLKCENRNPTGAFKVRGGLNLVGSLSPEEKDAGVLAVSTGNHAQSVAFAARAFGTRALIFMPEQVNPLKLARVKELGPRLILTGRDYDEARVAAELYAASSGMRYIHSANEPLLIAGVATCALELLREFPDIDTIFVPLGGGSGVLGAGLVARAVNPAIRVVGVQAAGAPAVYLSWKQGRFVKTESADTFAEGLATRFPFELPLSLLPRFVDEVMLVTDQELEDAIRLIHRATGEIAEGAGAAGVAAALRNRDRLAGHCVGIVLSGGNLAPEQITRILGSEFASRVSNPPPSGASPWQNPNP